MTPAQAEQIGAILTAAAAIPAALQGLRDNATEEQWEVICAIPAADELITACMELEAQIEAGPH